MKKILLFLCFFTSFTFYCQIEHFQEVAPFSFVATTSVINYTGSCHYLGTITINATGGKPPYTYSQDGINYVSNNVFDLPPDLYTMYAKDSAESIIIQEVMLYGLKDMPFYPILSLTNVSCNGGNDGSIMFDTNVTSGTYIYSINGGKYQTGNIISGLAAGTYSIGVSNTAVACGTMIPVTIKEPMHTLDIATAVLKNVSCSGTKNGSISATVTGGKAPYFYAIDGEDYVDSNTFYTLYAGTHSITVKDSNADCGTITNIIITEPNPIAATVNVDNQNIIINVTGGTGSYKYSIHPNTQSYLPEDNIYYNLYPGDNYTITVKDENDCIFEISEIVINPPTPLIDGRKAITIDFTTGQTLGDLIVEGQNIKWYSNQNPSTGKTSKSSETSLPLTTMLIDGITYYASQTINGIESIERLAVTAKLNGSLSAPDFVLGNFKYYPNPVQHTLNIDNPSTIDEIEIISVSGKSVLAKKINNTHSEINLSNVAAGVYLLKVKSEGKVKTIKIVKK